MAIIAARKSRHDGGDRRALALFEHREDGLFGHRDAPVLSEVDH
jgi:hypothetical protein